MTTGLAVTTARPGKHDEKESTETMTKAADVEQADNAIKFFWEIAGSVKADIARDDKAPYQAAWAAAFAAVGVCIVAMQERTGVAFAAAARDEGGAGSMAGRVMGIVSEQGTAESVTDYIKRAEEECRWELAERAELAEIIADERRQDSLKFVGEPAGTNRVINTHPGSAKDTAKEQAKPIAEANAKRDGLDMGM